MPAIAPRLVLPVLILGALFLSAGLRPELADVLLKDGTRLRGDVTETEDAIILRNAAGETRYPRDQVERIDYLPTPRAEADEYARRAAGLRDDDLAGHMALAEWAFELNRPHWARTHLRHVLSRSPRDAAALQLLQRLEGAEPAPAPDSTDSQPASAPIDEAADDALPGGPEPRGALLPAPPMSARDVNRLRLAEMRVDGPAERVPVRFPRRRGVPDFDALLRAEMQAAGQWNDAAQAALQRSRPQEKLQLALRMSGLALADHVEVRGDPEAFDTFRRRILPLVMRGCARSGCHGGPMAQDFRFPVGGQAADESAYAVFMLLDELETADGPLLNRTLPAESILVHYLMPPGPGSIAHPPTRRGRVNPLLRGPRDPEYQAIVSWISSLQSPRPDYVLNYQLPDWPIRQRQAERMPLRSSRPADPPDAGTGDERDGAESSPASRPAGDP